MNKIFPKRDLSLIGEDYYKFIEPLVRMRLNFVLGIILKYEGISIDLNTDKFVYKTIDYSIKISIEDKKRILNLFIKKLKKNKKESERVTFKSDKLILPSNLRDRRIYKTTITNETLNSTRFIDLLHNLESILKNEIDVKSGSYLDRQKTYCQNLTDDEKKIFAEIFAYKQIFQKKEDPMFYAATLAHVLNTPVCPYCNREYITSVRTTKGKKIIGPTFDHFLSQKDYPFLKLSFYNLIPSCTTCNSRLKNQKEFDFDYFLYPYNDSYEGIAKFNIRLGVKNIKSIIGKSTIIEEHKLSIRILAKSDNEKLFGPTSKCKEKGNLNVFQTQKIYNDSHKDVAFDILEKFERVPRSHIESTFNILKSLGKNHSEIYRFYFGNYPKEEDFNKRPLARMTRDIVEQLNDIYKLKILNNDQQS